MPLWSCSSESPLLSCRLPASCCVLTWWKDQRSFWDLLYEDTNPHDLIKPQRPHFLLSLHRAWGFQQNWWWWDTNIQIIGITLQYPTQIFPPLSTFWSNPPDTSKALLLCTLKHYFHICNPMLIYMPSSFTILACLPKSVWWLTWFSYFVAYLSAGHKGICENVY